MFQTSECKWGLYYLPVIIILQIIFKGSELGSWKQKFIHLAFDVLDEQAIPSQRCTFTFKLYIELSIELPDDKRQLNLSPEV